MQATSLKPVIERSWIEVVADVDPDTSYLEQDDVFADRFEAYKRGDFGFAGVRACAEVRFATPQGGWMYGPTVKSPGLWGIEDDSGEDYFRETGEEECRELADMLEALGINTSAAKLYRNAELRYA